MLEGKIAKLAPTVSIWRWLVNIYIYIYLLKCFLKIILICEKNVITILSELY